MPFTVLRRLDCVLEPTKPAVLEEREKREGQVAKEAKEGRAQARARGKGKGKERRRTEKGNGRKARKEKARGTKAKEKGKK